MELQSIKLVSSQEMTEWENSLDGTAEYKTCLLLGNDSVGGSFRWNCRVYSGKAYLPAVLRIHPNYSIPDPRSRIQGQQDSGSRIRIRIKNVSIFNLIQKIVSKLSEICSGCSSRISDPDLDFLPIPDTGVRKAPDPARGVGAGVCI